MIYALLPIVLVVSIASLAVAVRTLQSSRRAEGLSEDRYELLRDQYDQLEMLREERRMLTDQLEQESLGAPTVNGVFAGDGSAIDGKP